MVQNTITTALLSITMSGVSITMFQHQLQQSQVNYNGSTTITEAQRRYRHFETQLQPQGTQIHSITIPGHPFTCLNKQHRQIDGVLRQMPSRLDKNW